MDFHKVFKKTMFTRQYLSKAFLLTRSSTGQHSGKSSRNRRASGSYLCVKASKSTDFRSEESNVVSITIFVLPQQGLGKFHNVTELVLRVADTAAPKKAEKSSGHAQLLTTPSDHFK